MCLDPPVSRLTVCPSPPFSIPPDIPKSPSSSRKAQLAVSMLLTRRSEDGPICSLQTVISSSALTNTVIVQEVVLNGQWGGSAFAVGPERPGASCPSAKHGQHEVNHKWNVSPSQQLEIWPFELARCVCLSCFSRLSPVTVFKWPLSFRQYVVLMKVKALWFHLWRYEKLQCYSMHGFDWNTFVHHNKYYIKYKPALGLCTIQKERIDSLST